MKNAVDTKEINQAEVVIDAIISGLSGELDNIKSCCDSFNRYVSKLASYDGSNASSIRVVVRNDGIHEIRQRYQDKWNVKVSPSKVKNDFSSIEDKISKLSKESLDLEEIVVKLDKYIKDVENELGFLRLPFVLFDPMRTRGEGLDTKRVKEYISEEDYKKLLELCKKDGIDIGEILDACNKYSLENGCGGYSLLHFLNSKPNSKWKSKEEFFGGYLIKSFGVEKWYKEMKKKVDGDNAGPVSAYGASKILNDAGIKAKEIENYDANTFDKSEKDPLYNHLKNGGQATIMVEGKKIEGDRKYTVDDYKNTYYNLDASKVSKIYDEKVAGKVEKGIDNTYGNKHYISIVGIDKDDNLYIVDSANNSASNTRKSRPYDEFVNYVVPNNGKEKTEFHSGDGGCVLIY